MFSCRAARKLAILPYVLAMAGCIPAGQNSPIVASGPAGDVFPEVTGINLLGEEISLPGGFAGDVNLVAVAFERDQQALVDSWIESVDTLLEQYPSLRFYELPTIYEANALFRLWVNNGMRSGIPDSTARARTITAYLDRERFIELLAIPDMTDIHLLLLDGQGRILWRATGRLDASKLASLEDELSAWSSGAS